jgi:Ca2+-binding EF-hand superfamily protein
MDLKGDRDDLKELRDSFLEIDTNNDGIICIHEFQAAQKNIKGFNLGFHNWEQILRRIDLDGDGRLDFHEFYTATVNH